MHKNLEIIEQFLPANTAEYVLKLLERHPVKFKIVKPRKTKLGDFRVLNGKCQITINNNLEPLNFLITTIHEIAHLYNWVDYSGNEKIAPHGKEWKVEYKKLFLPILKENYFSVKEIKVLNGHLKKPKASSCADPILLNYFRKDKTTIVSEVENGQSFILNGRTFTKEKKLRTRYLCIEHSSNRKYYVNGMAEVNIC